MSERVKVKQLKKVVGDTNINGMFEEMMGVKDADPEIIIPKFVFVRNSARYVYKILNQFCKLLLSDFPEYTDHFEEIKKFSEDMKESTYLKHDHPETEDNYSALSKEDINGLYRKLKENKYIKHLIVLGSKLKRYETNFLDQNNFKENFINQEPGLSFHIFDFSSLDLKQLWVNNKIKPSVKRYVLTVLASLHKHTHSIYRCVTSPDVDVEKFTEMLINAISELKKQPQLHRCTNAFRRIEQSVHLLRDKFDDYYRDSVASENPDMLVMNFIVDVSNQGGANATLAREFRIIIKHMHSVSQRSGKNKDPNIQKIFKMLNNNFSLMEQKTGIKIDTNDQDIEPELADNLMSQPQPEINVNDEKQSKRIEKQKAKKKKKTKKAPVDQSVEQHTDQSMD
jgi:hypothetical protein